MQREIWFLGVNIAVVFFETWSSLHVCNSLWKKNSLMKTLKRFVMHAMHDSWPEMLSTIFSNISIFLQKHFFILSQWLLKMCHKQTSSKNKKLHIAKLCHMVIFVYFSVAKKIATCQTILSYSSSLPNATNAVTFWFCSFLHFHS